MARDIILTSKTWCDLVFNGKNQEYGAYEIRMTSSGRHIKALIIVAASTLIIGIALNLFKSDRVMSTGVEPEGPHKMYDFDQKLDEQNKIKQLETKIQPPVINASLKLTPPVIKRDDEVKNEDMISQAELSDKKDIAISVANVEGPASGGVNIADIKDNKAIVNEEDVNNRKVFEHVEQMPSFPGGETELMSFLGKQLKYPVIAQEQGIQGIVVLRFVVGKDGSISNVQIMRSLDSSCDKEAVRVINSMPKWVPGKQNGNPVMVYFTIPVRFKLAS